MSELDDAIARLAHAVARLEAASGRLREIADGETRFAAAAAEIAAHVDAALDRLGRLLDPEE
jgi:ABC-type transporter Mla subunit MlaD